MLYDNESYESRIQDLANMSGYFSIFVSIAVKINEGIQLILKKLYEIVNKSYMGLSREMEFHADEIAARVTGFEPLKNSLLRMTLADNSFNNVLNFYQDKISENTKSENIYRDQKFVLHFLGEVNNLKIKNNLPEVSLIEQNKFDKSKLVIKDQWASHPTIEERIMRLEKTGYSTQNNTFTSANDIFKNVEELQKKLTDKIFESVSYENETVVIDFGKFQEEYKNLVFSNSFEEIYNCYYDNKNLTPIDFSNSIPTKETHTLLSLFSDEKVDWVYTSIALQNDIEILKRISDNSLVIKTFDYDGVRYKRNNVYEIIEKLKLEFETVNEKIKINDSDIFNYFKKLEMVNNKTEELERFYNEFFEFDKTFDAKYNVYNELVNRLQFVNVTTPVDQIRINLICIKELEEKLLLEINNMLSDEFYRAEITKEMKENFEQYISKTWEYFSGTAYYNENLNMLYAAMHNYAYLLSRSYFLLKKKILAYQSEIVKDNKHQVIAEYAS